MDSKLLNGITICIGIVALVIAFGMPAFAGKPVPQLIIETVNVDFQNNLILIYGENFTNGSLPLVTLGSSELTVNTYSLNQIEAILPSNTPGGSYLLKVVTGTGSTQKGEFNVAIGASVTNILDLNGIACTLPNNIPGKVVVTIPLDGSISLVCENDWPNFGIKACWYVPGEPFFVRATSAQVPGEDCHVSLVGDVDGHCEAIGSCKFPLNALVTVTATPPNGATAIFTRGCEGLNTCTLTVTGGIYVWVEGPYPR